MVGIIVGVVVVVVVVVAAVGVIVDVNVGVVFGVVFVSGVAGGCFVVAFFLILLHCSSGEKAFF